MIKSILFIILIAPIIFFSSCADSTNYDVAGEQYLVTSTKTTLRERPRENSKKIGSLKKGDVIVAKYQLREWIVFDYKVGLASVDTSSLKSFVQIETEKAFDPELNPVAAETKDILGEYGDWASWKFWVILLGLSFASMFLYFAGKALPPIERVMEDGVVREWGHYFPYFTAFLGFLFAFVFLFWRDSVLHSIFVEPFWWYPEGQGGVAWHLWFISLLAVSGSFLCLVYFLVLHRIKGLFLMLFFLISGTVTFLNVAYLSIAGIVISIGVLIASVVIGFFFGSGSETPISLPDESEEIYFARKRAKEEEEREYRQRMASERAQE